MEVITKPLIPIAPIPARETEKNKGGRPCKFCQNKEAYLKITKDYLTSAHSLNKPHMVYLTELIVLLSANRETFGQWRSSKHDHGEFPDMVKEIEVIQEFRLQQRIMGRYNPTGAIFLLKTKHGYIETEKQVHAGDANEPLEIRIVEEKR